MAPPNIVFLVVESTDGRTWQRGYQNSVIPLPNIRALQDHGTAFHRHYANAPVCCPSRATFWSGRHAHKIPHLSRLPGSKLPVGGAWNNFEGLPTDFDEKIGDVLATNGYNVKILGKTDWSAGGHSLNVRLNSWTMYVRFPYNISANTGWVDETDDCRGNGSVARGGGPRGEGSVHGGDWKAVEQGVAWVKANANRTTPFFLYQGMNIVHPPYATNEHWYGKIDPSRVDVPRWPALEEMHPCDLQSSMLKGCLGSAATSPYIEAESRRRNVRRIYYAMIAEFDEMVGAYMEGVRAVPGAWERTVWVVTSDHGDMQMEHRQFYKMVPRDPSSSVPMVIFDGRRQGAPAAARVVTAPTQLIDIFPTLLELAGVDASSLPLDGTSLVPLLTREGLATEGAVEQGGAAIASEVEQGGVAIAGAVRTRRPPFVVSQFHGCNLAMSWFLVVQQMDAWSTLKYIVWGTGREVPAQLFNLSADPNESDDLLVRSPRRAATPAEASRLVDELDASLRSVVDYRTVAHSVARYNLESFRAWANATDGWEQAMHAASLRWTPSWDADASGAAAAVREWLGRPVEVLPCRGSLAWPDRS